MTNTEKAQMYVALAVFLFGALWGYLMGEYRHLKSEEAENVPGNCAEFAERV